jgi:hypothetical protein
MTLKILMANPTAEEGPEDQSCRVVRDMRSMRGMRGTRGQSIV